MERKGKSNDDFKAERKEEKYNQYLYDTGNLIDILWTLNIHAAAGDISILGASSFSLQQWPEQFDSLEVFFFFFW